MTSPGTRPRSEHGNPIAWLFVAAQAVLLLAIVVLPGPDTPVAAPIRTIGLVFEVVGLLVVVAGAVQLGISANVLPTPNQAGVLRTGGLYRLARHPIYFGVLLFAVGSAMRAPTLARIAAVVGLAVVLRTKAAWEERRLADKYSDYPSYAARTPAIVPVRLPRKESS